MPKRLDLTGKRFGHWTVLRFDHLHNEESKWLCQCDCGKVKVIYGSSLVKGTSTNCGCGRRLDLTGKIFGKLRVINFHSMDERGGSNWNCECSCGNSTVAYGPQLNFGLINSCGCLSKEHAKKIGHANKKDLTNKRFGRLLVLEATAEKGKNSRNIMWKCICDCGNIRVVNSTSLLTGKTHSCGCLAREIQRARALTLVGEKSLGWKGGISFEPYCPKFNDDLKKRVRSYFENRCTLCGIHEHNLKTKLCVHHVEYNKQACCDGLPVHFAALCRSCHAKTNKDRRRWEAMLHRVIDEIYNGRSYYTKEEYTELITCD